MKLELSWSILLAILLAFTIGLCFAYKSKLDSANRYIERIEKGTNSIKIRSEDVNIRSGRGGEINIIAGDGK